MDPWLRGVLLALQVTLNSMAEIIDQQDARIAQLEHRLQGR